MRSQGHQEFTPESVIKEPNQIASMKLQFPTQPSLLIGGEIYDVISALIG